MGEFTSLILSPALKWMSPMRVSVFSLNKLAIHIFFISTKNSTLNWEMDLFFSNTNGFSSLQSQCFSFAAKKLSGHNRIVNKRRHRLYSTTAKATANAIKVTVQAQSHSLPILLSLSVAFIFLLFVFLPFLSFFLFRFFRHLKAQKIDSVSTNELNFYIHLNNRAIDKELIKCFESITFLICGVIDNVERRASEWMRMLPLGKN